MKRTAFPPVFWVANLVEVLERFSYYGIYMGFGIYMEYLGYSKAQLGIIQSLFLLISYTIPVISGTFADRFGFKKVLIISYLAYLPSILLLILTESFSGIALTMLSIALAAGIFKPLVSGTVRAVTDRSNKTVGFGIFYAMVNIGASFGPLIAGKLRAISWNHAFIAAAVSIGFMLLITIFFYKEPEREIEGASLKGKFVDIWTALSDGKYLLFLILLGVFFWLPFWAFFNLTAIYIDKSLDTAQLYMSIKSLFGTSFANFLSHKSEDGSWRLLGETIAHTGYIIMILQIFVSRIAEKFRAIPTFLFGLVVMFAGFCVIGFANISAPAIVFLGIALFALGEMLSSPRIQEYITWIAPKEKAGLYMGTNFLSTGLGGALSGITYTSLYGYFYSIGHPDFVWYSLAVHMILGLLAIHLFTKILGEFKELEE
ncbi:MAG: MFS transporter [Candidatus Krumholzibacteriota bacterium]|nr:MFS transporter [Candidatus Krumholzibacteriota bacterium]